jgi:CheY-like chemotaxis protein
VPEELAEHLFLPLVSGRAEGSGLGLALAQQVAREHRGTLTYRSRPGHTVFTLLLPIGTKRAAPLAQPRSTRCRLNPSTTRAASGWSTTIARCASCCAPRCARPATVDGFDSAAAALDALGDRHVPDLLFTDVRMPGDDGLVLLDKLKPRPQLPVVVMSAYTDVASTAARSAAARMNSCPSRSTWTTRWRWRARCRRTRRVRTRRRRRARAVGSRGCRRNWSAIRRPCARCSAPSVGWRRHRWRC